MGYNLKSHFVEVKTDDMCHCKIQCLPDYQGLLIAYINRNTRRYPVYKMRYYFGVVCFQRSGVNDETTPEL